MATRKMEQYLGIHEGCMTIGPNVWRSPPEGDTAGPEHYPYCRGCNNFVTLNEVRTPLGFVRNKDGSLRASKY